MWLPSVGDLLHQQPVPDGHSQAERFEPTSDNFVMLSCPDTAGDKECPEGLKKDQINACT